jgi:hypothetical protein
MKKGQVAPLSDNERQYDAIIKALERACAQVEQTIGAGAGTRATGYPFVQIGRKSQPRPTGVHKIYEDLRNLLERAQEERTHLTD